MLGFEQGTAVKVGGRPGRYAERTNRGTPGICWRADARTLVSIYHDALGLSRADLLRIAGSMRPNPGRSRTPLVTPLDVAERLGLGTASGFDVVGGASPTTWTARNSWQPDAKGHPQEFEITAGSGVPAPDGGQQLVVNVHPARYIREVSSRAETSYLVLDLSRNYRLLIRSYTSSMYGNRPANLQDLVSIAERCHLDTRPLPWIGARCWLPERCNCRLGLFGTGRHDVRHDGRFSAAGAGVRIGFRLSWSIDKKGAVRVAVRVGNGARRTARRPSPREVKIATVEAAILASGSAAGRS